MSNLNQSITIDQAGGSVSATLGDLMGFSMDGVAPVYGFENIEAGTYEFRIKEIDSKVIEAKKDKNSPNEKVPRPVIAISCEVIGVRKLKNPASNPQDIVGKTHNENFFISRLDEGLGKLQAFLLGVGLQGKGQLKDLLEQAINREFVGVITSRKDKDDPTKEYANLDLKTIQPAQIGSAAPTGFAMGQQTQQVTPAVAAAPAGGFKLGG